MVMVIQVPLKFKPLVYQPVAMAVVPFCAPAGGVTRSKTSFLDSSDMEDAVIGHGANEGEHLELGHHKLERDERFPLRVTVQFYKATSNGVVDAADLENIRQCIEKAYTSADYIGSLVVGTLEKGDLGLGEARPTQPAPSREAVLSPPKDYLKVVNPFAPHQNPETGE